MSRTVQALILIVAAIGALLLGMELAERSRTPDNAGMAHSAGKDMPVPDSFEAFTMVDVSGVERSSSEWKDKLLLINFWATWCAPCREEIPVFSALAKQYRERGLEVIGIALDDIDAVRRFGDEIGLDYHSLVPGRDNGYALLEKHNPSGALPFSVLVRPDGRIVDRKLGLWHGPELSGAIEKALP